MLKINSSIARRLVLQAVVISLFTIIITILFTYESAKDIIITKTTNQLQSEATIRSTSIESILDLRATHTHILSDKPEIQKLVRESTGTMQNHDKEYLSYIAQFEDIVQNADIVNVIITDNAGNVLFSLERRSAQNISDLSYYQKAMNGSNFAEFGSSLTESGNIFSASPIGHDLDTPLGVLIITSKTASTDDILLNRSGLGDTGEVYLVNYDGVMISESRFLQHTQYSQIVDTLGVQNCLDDIPTVGIYPDYRDISIFGATHCSDSFILLAEIDEQEALKPIIKLETDLVLLGVIITALMGTVTFFTSRSISKPIIQLSNAAKNISAGNLNITTNIKSHDEIGQLSLAFDTMTKRLKEQMQTIKEKEDIIRYEEDILLQFSEKSETNCVCFIDIIDSTKTTQSMSDLMAGKLYEIFLNEVAEIIKEYHGMVIKNIGDALLFSFVIQNKDKTSISNTLDCCLAICDAHGAISKKLTNLGLPKVNYRISVSFGFVRVASSSTSTVHDIFGSTVNRCSKINHMAKPNSIVTDEALYRVAASMEKYTFEMVPASSQYNYRMYHFNLKSRK